MSTTDAPAIPPQVAEFLRGRHVLTLATVSPAGQPHAATLVFTSDDEALYFSTRSESTTGANLVANPFVAFTVDCYDDDWSKSSGVQGTGECRRVEGDAAGRVVERFREKFPALDDDASGGLAFYRIDPVELTFIGGGATSGQSLAMEYRREILYSVFRDLPVQAADTIAGSLEQLEVAAGETVVRQGDPAERFFIVVSGRLEVRRREDGGEERVLNAMGPGQFFGEVAIMQDRPRTASVVAVEPSTLLALDRSRFRDLVSQSLAMTSDFDAIVRERLSRGS